MITISPPSRHGHVFPSQHDYADLPNGKLTDVNINYRFYSWKENKKLFVLKPFGTSETENKVYALLDPVDEIVDALFALSIQLHEFVTPLVAYLVSEQCELTHEIFDVGGGRYARIFIGMSEGWVAPKGSIPTPDDLFDNIDRIRDQVGTVCLR